MLLLNDLVYFLCAYAFDNKLRLNCGSFNLNYRLVLNNRFYLGCGFFFCRFGLFLLCFFFFCGGRDRFLRLCNVYLRNFRLQSFFGYFCFGFVGCGGGLICDRIGRYSSL